MNTAGLVPEGAGWRLLSNLGKFLTWWRWGLAAWLPRGWRNLLGCTHDRLMLYVQDEELFVFWDGDGQLRETARLPAAAGPPQLDRLLVGRAATLPRWWLIPAGLGLCRRLRLPSSAARHLRQIVGFEIDRQTPFATADVYYDARVIGYGDDKQMEVELAVVPKRTLDGLLREQGEIAATLAGVELADAQGQPLGFNLLLPVQRSRQADPLWRWNLLLATIALLAIVAAGAQILENRHAAADALQQKIAAQSAQAREVTAQRTRLSMLVNGAVFLDTSRANQPAVIEVWDEVTRLLPDGTWLEKFSIQGEQLLLVGSSDDAPSLVACMERSQLWRKPALVGALQSDNESGNSRFTLTAQLMQAPTEAPEAVNGHGAH